MKELCDSAKRKETAYKAVSLIGVKVTKITLLLGHNAMF